MKQTDAATRPTHAGPADRRIVEWQVSGATIIVLADDGKFAEHRRRQIAAGNDKPDGWPQFVREFRDYVPPPLLPARGAA